MTDNEKLDILLQVMACIGEYPMPIENIMHDTGFSRDETIWQLVSAICEGYPVKVTINGEFYYKSPVEKKSFTEY